MQHGKQRSRHKAAVAFLLDYELIEIALGTRGVLVDESSLRLASTERAGNRPTGPAGVSASMDAVQFFLCRGGTNPVFMRIDSARFSAASLEFPAVGFRVHITTPMIYLVSFSATCVLSYMRIRSQTKSRKNVWYV